MNYADYFTNKGLSLEITPDDNLKIKGLSSLQDDLKNQVLQYAKENKWCTIFELQTNNKTLEEKYNIFWNQATKLADLIDDPDSGVNWQDRAARVPELQEMITKISDLEQQIKNCVEVIPDTGKRYKGLEGVWYPYYGET